MPYNGSGVFSVVNTFVPNTTISSSQTNANNTDFATNGFSAVLPRDGQAAMTGQFKAANGTALAPSVTFGTDLNLGRYRKSADVMADVCDGAEVVEYSSTGINVTGQIRQNGAALFPVGVVLPYAGASAPTGYLLCYGQEISRSTYALLFAAIGTGYGAGNGSTTFNVPDLRGRVPAGKDNMGGSSASRLTSTTMSPDGNTLAAVGGTQTHTLTGAESGQKAIAAAPVTITDPGHVHTVPTSSGGARADGPSGTPSNSGTNTGSATTGITAALTLSASSASNAHLNVQPTIITNYIIFAGI